MIICKVIGHVWATKKEEALEGIKLMVVQESRTNQKSPSTFVAADRVGAGIGEDVLVGRDDLPVDCAIVGIIDTVEVEKEAAQQGKSGK